MAVTQFAVLGLGRFGRSVALALANKHCEVLGVDKDEHIINDMMSVLTQAVVADVTDRRVLQELGIRNFDCVVVGIGSIESSVLVTVMAKEMGVKMLVTKASSDVHGRALTLLGADRVIYPERDMGERLAQSLVAPNLIDYIELSPDSTIAEVTVPESLVGKSLRQSNLRQVYGVNVVAVRRDKTVNVSPNVDEPFRKGDGVVIIGNNDSIRQFEQA